MGKQPNPMIGTRVSADWKIQIEAIAKATGRNSSQVVYEAIAQYLGRNDAATMGNQIQVIMARLDALERQQQGVVMLLGK